MRASIIGLAISLLLVGCASLDAIRTQNRQRLLSLSPGMSKQEVLSIMGTKTIKARADDGSIINNPYRTEMYQSQGHTFELLLYYTDKKHLDYAITDDELTPLIIMDGKLDGWGWSYLDGLVQKYELRVR
ncbi:MAG: DUF3192 domain-containing protein [Nanoarchaeota archaeon]